MTTADTAQPCEHLFWRHQLDQFRLAVILASGEVDLCPDDPERAVRIWETMRGIAREIKDTMRRELAAWQPEGLPN